MTNEELIRAARCCKTHDCTGCPYAMLEECPDCSSLAVMLADALEKAEPKQSVLDLYRDARNEWIHDPSVGLYGPNEDEAALMDAVEKVLEVKDETNL